MTADPATYPAVLSPAVLSMPGASPRRPDPVRARVCAGRQTTHSESSHTAPAQHRMAHAERSGLHLLADTRGTGPRGPHPGDVLYWVACLGGACLLLLCATT